MRLFSILLFLVMGWLHPQIGHANSSLGVAIENYDDGNYELAYRQFRALAELGLADAQFNVGVMHLRGEYVEQQLVEAYAWIKLAAEQGKENYSQLSSDILAAINDENRQRLAQSRFKELNATHSLAVVMDKLKPQPSDTEPSIVIEPIKRQAPKYPRKAAKALVGGITKLQFYVYPDGSVRYPVVMYSEPAGLFDEASIKAIEKWRFAPPTTSTGELVTTPKLLTQIIDFKIDSSRTNPAVKQYAERLERLVKQDDPAAKYLYAISASSIGTVELEQTEIDQLMLEAAMAGVVEAQYEIAQRLLVGKRCKQDEAKAYRWLEIAALADHAASQYHLAERPSADPLLFGGDSNKWDYLVKAAESGYPAAVMELAWRLATATNATTNTAKRAEALLEKLPDHYERGVRWYEIHAAIDALNENYGAAEKRQRSAIKLATKLDWTTTDLDRNMARIQRQQRIQQSDLFIPESMPALDT